MRLKRIKLAGFKSFVDATTIPFPGEMTAIVGPNGCGKSNVIDAVRWVLGESSAKNLRGDAMTDVIFNGSSARKPVSQCSVELVFDNTSNRVQGEFAKYNELSVKRIVTRDAVSTYLLNGTKCRRRDVTDIFLGTGLGPRSYAIIEQGMISRLIESKPQELRVFIEEAAGISKYKERRRETENRIRHTRENLERLSDVRGELATQLDKLQRQAAAAKRYKELKRRERELKAQLAAMRWLGFSEKVSTLQQQIEEGETQIESLIAEQRGDERKLIEQRQRQFELKQALDALQKKMFDVSTEIARLEQNQKFVTQRSEQINRELTELEEKALHLRETYEQNQLLLEELLASEIELAPEHEMSLERLTVATEQRDSAETALMEFNQQFRQQEQTYQQLKQQSQSCHSQIQSTMSMQLRTQQRLSEVTNELEQLSHDHVIEQLESMQEQLLICDHQLADAQQNEQELQHKKVTQADVVKDYQEQLNQHQQHQHRLSAEREALLSLQQEQDEFVIDDPGVVSVWQSIRVKAGAEALVDTAMASLQSAYVIDNEDQIKHEWNQAGHLSLLLSDYWTSEKEAGSVAALIESSQVPVRFNHIFVADDRDHADTLAKELQPHQWAITADGYWRGKDAVIFASNIKQGGASRAAKIEKLSMQADEQADKIAGLSEQLSIAMLENEQLLQAASDADHAVRQAQLAKQQLQSQVGMLELQAEQTAARQRKLAEDKEVQQQLLDKEQLQLEELSVKLEVIEEQLLDHESSQLHAESDREKMELKVQDSRAQVEQLTQQKHQLDIQYQQLKNQIEGAKQQLDIQRQQVQDTEQRQQSLQQELSELHQPQDASDARIAELLAMRETLSVEQRDKSDDLAQVEAVINDAQRDSQGLNERLQQRRSQLESLKLESQGFQVRASGVLEQFAETQQNLKTTLETLPPEAEEGAWQNELEKTQAGISRLGAVNLAAVEEFEAQAERKQHLDTQFDDLQAALDTLEDAIRKIDKETKTRFRHTYDQVNDDLKQLFPKVFGGGSAYLDLTGDDLLETGVTIMARPPGKKNSTIHLLSGGEKALTALSLVFAIFRLNPAPFCLLDEVDAPLDDANVARFCRLVSEMSKTVQFIYITHNKIAMEMAEHLTGVTMAEPGVSRMVAVDVEEAVAIANA
ncbi:chromosome segregation protein SMC [Alteromonas facilis]|uniref:chromosome segregation protein SMC n=1 Tax=Alteromonas facilis TaxID=2048004 RepID=UPI000C291AF5|nr:chromosome segregation protein SMC [Alteromonas facilis]